MGFRVDPETDRLVRRAAQTSEMRLTEFVVQAAVVEADRVLANRRELAVEAELYSRPVTWHCIYCGWRCDESWNDYVCNQCGAIRPMRAAARR